MRTELRDVFHLYLAGNVQVEYEGRIGNVFTYYHPAGKYMVDKVWVCSLEQADNPEMSCEAGIDKCMLLLRPLSDMTHEELQGCGNMIYDFSDDPELNNHKWEDFKIGLAPEQFQYLLSKGFDLFGLIESGQAIDKTKIKPNV